MVGDQSEKIIRVRWDGACGTCEAVILQGSRSWWDGSTKALTCLDCHVEASATVTAAEFAHLPPPPIPPADIASCPPAPPPPPPAPIPAVPAPLSPLERGIPGASARAVGERKARKREDRIRTDHPTLGGLILRWTDEPANVKNWTRGAIGEEKLGDFLETARPKGIEVLHDRRIPGSRANIDHIVVAPTGLWVVDAKRHEDQLMERRPHGGKYTRGGRLYVGGRDRSSYIAGVRKQMQLVRTCLSPTAFAGMRPRGALCFVDVKTKFLASPFTIDDVLVTWRKQLLRSMLDVPKGFTPPTGLERAEVARLLAEHFPRA